MGQKLSCVSINSKSVLPPFVKYYEEEKVIPLAEVTQAEVSVVTELPEVAHLSELTTEINKNVITCESINKVSNEVTKSLIPLNIVGISLLVFITYCILKV